jgi:hypothetical protein
MVRQIIAISCLKAGEHRLEVANQRVAVTAE